jgi:hypothetical protein
MIGQGIKLFHFIEKYGWDRNLSKSVSIVQYERFLIDHEIICVEVGWLRTYYSGNAMGVVFYTVVSEGLFGF